MERESIQKFDKFLKKKIVDINKGLKDIHGIDESEKTAELAKYKSLLFTKHRLSYFIRCIEDDNCLDSDELFISFRPLSDLIIESPLDDKEKTDVALFYANLNNKVIGNLKEQFIPAAESIYDNYNILMGLSVGEIHNLCVKKSLLSLIKENGKASYKYQQLCNGITHSYLYSLSMLLNYAEASIDDINSSKASFITVGLMNIGYKENVLNLVYDLLYNSLYENRKYEDPVACYLYCVKCFLKYATDKDCTPYYKRAEDIVDGALKTGNDVSKKELVMLDELVQYLVERGKDLNMDLPLKLEKCQKPLK